MPAAATASGPPPEKATGASGPGLAERPGERLPADLQAVDDRGEAVKLADLFDRPVILSLVYYTCEHVCPLTLGALGEFVSASALRPGRDYRLVTLSFDPSDKPGDAATARANYARPLGPSFPAGAWSFLTASELDIDRLTAALGFRFEKHLHGFIHPAVLVVIGPGGRIATYVHVTRTSFGVGYPVTFPPGPMTAALQRAAAGATGPPDPAPLLFCFPGEPRRMGRFYGLMTAMGAGTLVLMAALFVYLSAVRRRPRPGGRGS